MNESLTGPRGNGRELPEIPDQSGRDLKEIFNPQELSDAQRTLSSLRERMANHPSFHPLSSDIHPTLRGATDQK